MAEFTVSSGRGEGSGRYFFFDFLMKMKVVKNWIFCDMSSSILLFWSEFMSLWGGGREGRRCVFFYRNESCVQLKSLQYEFFYFSFLQGQFLYRVRGEGGVRRKISIYECLL